MTVCPECGEPIGTPSAETGAVVWGTIEVRTRDDEGNEALDDLRHYGLFHQPCWEAFKQKNPLPEAPQDADQPP